MWQANVFTIFPEVFPANLGVSVIGKALKQEKWQLNLVDLKQFPVKSDRIDSAPYGGGEGMVLSPITFKNAFDSLLSYAKSMRRFYFSPRGRQLTQKDIQSLSKEAGITMLCGRYEGVDQRILDSYEIEEISIGDFVLLGGEVAAMTIIEACVRLLPEVVGNENSICNDSFKDYLLEYNQYTKPQDLNGALVPDILVSGNYRKVEEFRLNQSKQITARKRPDLWDKYIAIKLSEVKNEI